ncbi:MAG TPA: Crp/Fnr family transcriptional regulator [Bacteroidia bacterium]|nr:Crp/Fnr family transcriptional regulator [Bacteroidia bacterium]
MTHSEACEVLIAEISSRWQIPPADLANLSTFFDLKTIKKNEYYFRSGAVLNEAIFIARGCLKQYTLSEDGNERIIFFAEENWWAGELASMRAQVPTKYNLVALEDSILLTLSVDKWAYAYTHLPWFAEMYHSGQQCRVKSLEDQLLRSLSESVETRYLRLLNERPLLLQRVSQYHVAAFLGVSPEALSRVRKRLYNV